MLKSNFLETLRTLTRDELNSFIEFVPWALHKDPVKREEAVKLLDILIVYFPEFNHPSLTSKKIFKKMFPDKPYIDLKIDKIMGSLTKCLRIHFLTLRYLEPENEFNHLLEICQFHKEKRLSARYQQSFRQLESLLTQNQPRSLDSIYKNYLLEYERLDWLSIANDHKTDINLVNTMLALQQFADVNMMDLLIRYALQLKIIKFEIPELIRRNIEKLFNQSDIITDSLYQTYHAIFKIFYAPKVTHQDFGKSLTLIQANENIFDYETLYTLHVYLRNLCTILINQGNRELRFTIFELQRQSIASGFHFYKGKISPSSFISAVINALNVKEVEWTRDFIDENKDLIIGETPDKIYFRFCWAQYLYHNGQYEQALDFIPQNIKEISYILIARRLEIKAFYEYDFEVSVFKAEAFRTYVSRLPNYNFPKETMNYNVNFARFIIQIQQMPVGVKERAYRVIERIAERQYVSDREWLYEKARLRGNLTPEEVEAIVLQTPVLEEQFEEKEAK
ncbi:MAG: hypothetical protein NW218_19300 [Saprospiraceae bacterium]|nr:hypothetical protein [Saprospiraceae bacterium]